MKVQLGRKLTDDIELEFDEHQVRVIIHALLSDKDRANGRPHLAIVLLKNGDETLAISVRNTYTCDQEFYDPATGTRMELLWSFGRNVPEFSY